MEQVISRMSTALAVPDFLCKMLATVLLLLIAFAETGYGAVAVHAAELYRVGICSLRNLPGRYSCGVDCSYA